MYRRTKGSAYRWALIALAGAALAGCNANKGTVDGGSQVSTQQSIAAIKNNPNIPDQAKAQIIGAIQQRASTATPQH